MYQYQTFLVRRVFPKHDVTTITNVRSKQGRCQADKALPYLELAPIDFQLTWSRIVSSPQTTSILLKSLP